MGKDMKPQRDPRGHSLRIYSDLYDSPAFAALSPHDVMAYLALLRELKGYNNGDLSLPLSRAKRCGINHHMTLARSLRALCAVGLVALTRKGGCTKGGQRLPSLYRVTDRACFDLPTKFLTAMAETNEWKRVTSVAHGLQLIEAAESAIKKTGEKTKTAGHGVTATTTRHDVVSPITTLPRDPWPDGLGHGVTMAKSGDNPIAMRVCDGFSGGGEKADHRTPRAPPLYIATPTLNLCRLDTQGVYQRLRAKPTHLFVNLVH
jgi:predicted transcriptional regulator